MAKGGEAVISGSHEGQNHVLTLTCVEGKKTKLDTLILSRDLYKADIWFCELTAVQGQPSGQKRLDAPGFDAATKRVQTQHQIVTSTGSQGVDVALQGPPHFGLLIFRQLDDLDRVVVCVRLLKCCN